MAMGIDTFPKLSSGKVGYMDDVVIWISGTSVEAVRSVIESTANAVVAVHGCKLYGPQSRKDPGILDWFGEIISHHLSHHSNSLISPVETIDFLGLKFDYSVNSDPHIRKLISDVASLAGVARHLKVYLPSNLVAEVVRALLVGKIGYGIAAAPFPRLNHNALRSYLTPILQVWVNYVAKAICGMGRAFHQSVAFLLERSGLPSVNRLLMTRLVAIEA